ncbi:hypothetical protein AMS68_007253 [Peltaster fructicola]|uniref:Inositol polyphosphate-related phosphatase domain-containing protein n=1 Tax=Peltaster fructicola TaxID=286661 RepID=A0A6H0Y450_9PEZI|nr:hypothetical protein AMS68_007253 [Peltaster fructicola]
MLQPNDWLPTRSSFEDRGSPRDFLIESNIGRAIPQPMQDMRRTQDSVGREGRDTRLDDGRQTAVTSMKPQVPHKKPTLAAKFSDRLLLNPLATSSETAVTPQIKQNTVNALSNFSPVGLKSRDRVNSDASWVERLRADSDASSQADIFRDESRSPEKNFAKGRRSPKKMTRSSRVQSNASWVETLDSPVRDVDDQYRHQLAREIVESEHETHIPSLPPRPAKVDDTPDLGVRAPPSLPRQPTTSRTTRSTHDQSRSTSAASRSTVPDRQDMTFTVSQSAVAPQVYPQASSRVPSAASSTVSLIAPPTVPPPRRSLDRRREITPDKTMIPPTSIAQPTARTSFLLKVSSDTSLSEKTLETSNLIFPDISAYNRRPPTWRQRPSQIHTEYDTRLLAVSGDLVCTSGFITRVWDVRTGQQIMNVVHPENFKVTAIAFKPAPTTNAASSQVWLGTSTGELHELDVRTQRIVDTSQRAHKGREVVKIYAQRLRLFTLDSAGNFAVWKSGKDGSPSLQSQFQLFHTQRGYTASVQCGSQIWIATGRDVRIYKPAASSESDFQVGHISLLQMNIGEVTSAATVETQPDLIYFGHTDGKISICSRSSMRCMSTVHVSLNKIGHIFGAGQYLWTGFGTGTIQVYDTSVTPWNTMKEWPAHSKQISSISCDISSLTATDGLRVVTLGADNIIKLWDGLFEDDWVEQRLHLADSSFCDFSEITASVLTWNAGAAKPGHLQHSIEDDNFLRDYIAHNAHCDIFVFGFQELVDLEDKKLTAKSFFKAKKKDAFEQEHMTHQYRAWRDHLTTRVKEYAAEEYTNLHTASMIGLFTCIFVRASLRRRIKHVHQAEVKRGMGGHYGNKGALVLRMVLDDSSVCFVNCHLAAGQTQTSSRNSDAAAILETECLPSWPLDRTSEVEHSDVFVSGGDGSVVLDHELCILNGDLNYRIDTMSRDTVVKQVQQGNLSRLLDRDQLLLSRKKNPGFKLRAMQESQIQFNPTYKYNVGSNEYDTSEKRRSPAWCDRILYRGLGKIKCDEYRRWEVRVSDHRPVSALLTCRVRRVDTGRQAHVLQRCLKEFKAYKQEVLSMAQSSD